jgi:ribosomal protein S14
VGHAWPRAEEAHAADPWPPLGLLSYLSPREAAAIEAQGRHPRLHGGAASARAAQCLYGRVPRMMMRAARFPCLGPTTADPTHSPFPIAPARVCSKKCGNNHGMIRKYHMNLCRRCFREAANAIGFYKVRAVHSPVCSADRGHA